MTVLKTENGHNNDEILNKSLLFPVTLRLYLGVEQKSVVFFTVLVRRMSIKTTVDDCILVHLLSRFPD